MGGIINKKKLATIQAEIEARRASIHNVNYGDLVALAKKLGREKSKKGKHPTYESIVMPQLTPLSIPGHAMGASTKRKILDHLEADISFLSDYLDQQERQQNDAQRLPKGTVHKSLNP